MTDKQINYWTRTIRNDNNVEANYSHIGDFGFTTYHNNRYYRPFIIIPLDTYVLDDGSLTAQKPPVITSPSGASGTNLGVKSSPFSFQYTVTSTTGNVTVTEKLDGATIKTRSNVASGSQFTFDGISTTESFLKVTNTSHTLTVSATDGVFTTDFTFTFTKKVTTATVSHASGFETEELAAVAAMRLIGDIPEDAEVKIELTNNFGDDSPMWEDASAELLANRNYAFTNQTAANGNVFNFRITLSRGPSDTGGYLSGIVGTFQGADD